MHKLFKKTLKCLYKYSEGIKTQNWKFYLILVLVFVVFVVYSFEPLRFRSVFRSFI